MFIWVHVDVELLVGALIALIAARNQFGLVAGCESVAEGIHLSTAPCCIDEQMRKEQGGVARPSTAR